MSKEDLYALTWEAATDRLIAAGCIPKAEADRLQKTLSSEATGIEVRGNHSIRESCSSFVRSHCLRLWKAKKAEKDCQLCLDSLDIATVSSEPGCHKKLAATKVRPWTRMQTFSHNFSTLSFTSFNSFEASD